MCSSDLWCVNVFNFMCLCLGLMMCLFVFVYVYVCMMCACVCLCACVCVLVCLCVCLCVCVFVCLCVCVFVVCVGSVCFLLGALSCNCVHGACLCTKRAKKGPEPSKIHQKRTQKSTKFGPRGFFELLGSQIVEK